ncbi:ORFx [Bocaparvovirus primate1]|uniref:ORFx n=1 Tax=Primate bocaparvovirus 1 (strain Human bocavirus 1 type 1) TaxID=689403 RepID=J9RYC7_HBOC1|nr:ORFx [Bocaparvovirus primate1]QCP71049.1 ORFx [Human bocavirus]BDB39326.1 orfx [Human bocavirus 1]AFR53045.1 ORFx [Bocaparvovirus primate1]QXM26706.1 ORFx [Human bocavirus]UVH33439.1 ORFx [Human bocavirus]
MVLTQHTTMTSQLAFTSFVMESMLTQMHLIHGMRTSCLIFHTRPGNFFNMDIFLLKMNSQILMEMQLEAMLQKKHFCIRCLFFYLKTVTTKYLELVRALNLLLTLTVNGLTMKEHTFLLD